MNRADLTVLLLCAVTRHLYPHLYCPLPRPAAPVQTTPKLPTLVSWTCAPHMCLSHLLVLPSNFRCASPAPACIFFNRPMETYSVAPEAKAHGPSPNTTATFADLPYAPSPNVALLRDSKPRPYQNLGSSCFINGLLQALYGSRRLRTLYEELASGIPVDVRRHVAIIMSSTATAVGLYNCA